MQENQLQRRYKKRSTNRSKRLVPMMVTVVFLLISTCLVLSYIKHNQNAFHAQAALLRKKWADEQKNGVPSNKLMPLQKQLSTLEKKHLGPIPVIWFPHLVHVQQQLKHLSKQTSTIWVNALGQKKQQALAALSDLKKTEGAYFSDTKQDQADLKKAKTPRDYQELVNQWSAERKSWLAEQAKLKKISGGWINHHPADVVKNEQQLVGLLKKLSSHPSDRKKANDLLNQTNHYFKMSLSSQLQQHSAIKNKLQSMIATIKNDEIVPVTSNEWLFNEKITNYINSRAGQVSIALYDAKNGHTYLYHPELKFDTASIVKVSIMADLLHKANVSGHSLNQQEKGLMVPMIENSSNSAATQLWNMAGGAQGIETILDLAGMGQTRPGEDGEWGLTKTSALDQVKLMRLFAFPNAILNTQQRKYGLNLMEHVTSWERWGVSSGIPSDATVALKNGWLPYPSKWWINSIGYINGSGRDYVIAVLTGGNATEKYGIQTIDQISHMIWSELGGK